MGPYAVVAERGALVTDSTVRKMIAQARRFSRFRFAVNPHILRNFGFPNPNSKRLIAWFRYLLGVDPNQSWSWIKKRPLLWGRDENCTNEDIVRFSYLCLSIPAGFKAGEIQ